MTDRQEQVKIIQAHLQGKNVMCAAKDADARDWLPVVKGAYEFDFVHMKYKVEPLRVHAFMIVTDEALQKVYMGESISALIRPTVPAALRPGYKVVQINFLGD